jgi:geranylgeranylglycerol-phosphate geranylgeranyltransferase
VILIRLHNCILAGVGVWMGWYLTSSDSPHHLKILLASVAAALVCGAGNTLNDYLDIKADRANHPNRPLPRGDLPPYLAVLTTFIFNIIAIAIGFLIDWSVLLIIVCAIVLLVLYNFKLKKMPLVGNLAVSVLGGATFIVGGLIESGSLGPLPGAIVPAVFAFLFHLGRELIKDVADLEGDLKADYRTLAAMLPIGNLLNLIMIVFATLIALTLIPVYYEWYRPIFAYIVCYIVNIPMLMIIFFLYKSRNKNRFGLAGNLMKGLMLLGLLAFYLGKKSFF